jgi:hypothetical protein
MQTIEWYHFPTNKTGAVEINMPIDARILSLGHWAATGPCVWALVNPCAVLGRCRFEIRGAGAQPPIGEAWTYLGIAHPTPESGGGLNVRRVWASGEVVR